MPKMAGAVWEGIKETSCQLASEELTFWSCENEVKNSDSQQITVVAAWIAGGDIEKCHHVEIWPAGRAASSPIDVGDVS